MSTDLRHASTRIAIGQCLRIAVDAGTMILVRDGAVRIEEAPQWLGETMVAAGRCCEAGESCRVARSGWLTLQALRDARLIVVAAPGRSPWRWEGARAVRRWLGLCRDPHRAAR